MTRSHSPKLNFDSFLPTCYSTPSYISDPAVSINSRGFVMSPITAGCRSESYLLATEGCATSLSWYICSLDHFMISSFILYYSTSIVENSALLLNRITLSKRERLSPFLLASSDLTVASSCLWSPASTSRFANWIAIQHAGSMACAHSSITSTSKRESCSL